VLIVAIGIFTVTGKFLVLGAGAIIITVGLFVNLKKTKS